MPSGIRLLILFLRKMGNYWIILSRAGSWPYLFSKKIPWNPEKRTDLKSRTGCTVIMGGIREEEKGIDLINI